MEEARGVGRGATGHAVILSANPIHDTGGGQRSAQLALELLERGFAVDFVSHGTVTETVDLGLRYDHERLRRWSLTEVLTGSGHPALAECLSREAALVVTQVPVREWLPVLEDAARRGVPTVYDCIDRWDSELGRGWYRWEVETEIARSSSVLTASAPALVDHVESLTGRETALVPNAYNARIFDPSRVAGLERPEAFPADGRVALYVGALWGGWLDWTLVRRLVADRPELAFVFVGDHRREGRGLPDRCVFTGLVAQTELPAYVAHADVGFLPWKADEVTSATSPLKVYEWVAMGLPVVAPDIEPLRGIPGVRTVENGEDFARALAFAGRDGLSKEERSAMRGFAAASTWSDRVDRILALAEGGRGAPGADPRADVVAPVDGARTGAAAPGPGTRRRAGSASTSRGADRATISVVIPAFDHQRWIAEALDSVEAQTLPPGEIVVVDDGSSDGTAGVVAEWSRSRREGSRGRMPVSGTSRAPAEVRLVRQANRGAHHALDRAVRLAAGDWIAVLNSDDAYEPERLEHAWGVARETGAALVCGSVRLVDGDGGDVPESHEIARWYREARSWAEEVGSLSVALRRHNVAVTTSNFLFHRELWERLGGFRAYRYVHDYDFLIRAVGLCPDRVVHEPSLGGVLYRVHEANTITERIEVAAEERRQMVAAHRRPTERLGRWVRRWTEGRAVSRAVERSSTLTPTPRSAPEPVASPQTDVGSATRGGPAERRGPPGRGTSRERLGPRPTVGLIVDSLGTGGLEEVVALLARSLPSTGLRTAVLCASRGGPVADRLREAGVRLEVLDGAPEGIVQWLEEERVVAASSHFAPVDVVSSLAEAGVPVVETVQNTYAWFGDDEWERERRRVDALVGVIAVSETAAAYYRQHVGRAPDWIIPNAVHPSRAAAVPRRFARRALGLPRGAPVFAFVGRITVQKNPSGLLDAFTHVADRVPDAILLMAGPDDGSVQVSRLRRRHAALFRRGSVRHLPSPRHVGTVLTAADAYVSAAFHEGWSVAASEAAWIGRPLILTDTGGSRELVGAPREREWERGRTPAARRPARGIVVPNPCGDPLSVSPTKIGRPPDAVSEESVAGLAEAMISLAGNRPEWRERRAEIAGWARAELCPEVIAGRYAEILRAAGAGRLGRGP